MMSHLESCIWLAVNNPERQEHDGREWICDPACPFNAFNGLSMICLCCELIRQCVCTVEYPWGMPCVKCGQCRREHFDGYCNADRVRKYEKNLQSRQSYKLGNKGKWNHWRWWRRYGYRTHPQSLVVVIEWAPYSAFRKATIDICSGDDWTIVPRRVYLLCSIRQSPMICVLTLL